jgi:hypothetical protein
MKFAVRTVDTVSIAQRRWRIAHNARAASQHIACAALTPLESIEASNELLHV